MEAGETIAADRGRGFGRAALDLLRRKDATAVARRAAATALTIRLGNAGLAYVAQVVLARLMGQFEYGVFAYTWVWFLVSAAVATLGFGDSPVRYVAQLRARGEDAHLRGFLRFAPLVILITSVSFGIVMVTVLPFAADWLGRPYVLPMALMAISIPFVCLQSFLEGVGRSYGWTIPALVPVYIFRHGLLLVFMVAAVHLGFAPTAVNAFLCLVLTVVISLSYQAVAILSRLRRALPAGPIAYRAGEWLKGSAPFSVLYGCAHLSSFADVMVLSFFVSPGEIAVYFAATRIIQVVNLVPYAATVGTAHLFSDAHTRGNRHELQRLCRHVALTTFLIAVAAVGVIIAAGDWLLGMFGGGYAAGYVPLAILAAGVLARVTAGPAEDMLNMTGNSGLSASTYFFIVLLNIALNICLIIPFGLAGAAVATSTALMLRALYLALAVRSRLGINTSVPAALLSLRRDWLALRHEHLATPAE